MGYAEDQAALAATPEGRLAASMRPGSRWRTPEGDVVVVWMAWRPRPEAAADAERYGWAPPGPGHNTEIGITHPRRGTQRVKVTDVGGWIPAER